MILLALMIMLNQPALAQYHSRHEKVNFEMAVIPLVAYDLGEKGIAYGIHTHLLFPHSQLSDRIAVGAGFEYITGGEVHLTTGPVVAIHPWRNLVLVYSPGITLKRGEEVTEYFFSSHFEAALEFEIGDHFHIGPSVGFNMSGYDNHVSGGLHTGFSF